MVSYTAPPTLKGLLEIALRSIQQQGWVSFSLEQIAQESGYPLEVVQSFFPDKKEVVRVLFREIQRDYEERLSSFLWTSQDSTKDQLFEGFMARFDVLETYKGVIIHFWRGVSQDPLLALLHERMSEKFLGALLQKVSLPPSFLGEILRVKALYLLYLWTFKTWILEERGSHDQTMAVLDRGLEQLQRWGVYQ